MQALDGVSFRVPPGEVHALVGENGAGKSTLVKILAGLLAPDEGGYELRGQDVLGLKPHEILRRGVSFVHQEPPLVPTFSAVDNVLLGLETEAPRRGLLRDLSELENKATSLLARVGFDESPSAPIASLGMGKRSLVALAQALIWDPSILVLDEPTAALGDDDVVRFFEILRELQGEGAGIVFISHRLDEVAAVSGHVSVLRDGRMVASLPSHQASRDVLIEAMVGEVPTAKDHQQVAEGGSRAVVLRVEDFTGGIVRGATLTLRSGEVTALAGLVGSGRTELARLLVGADTRDSGRLELEGAPLSVRSPKEAMKKGIILIPEDRHREGLIAEFSMGANVSLSNLGSIRHFSPLRLLSRRKERALAEEVAESLSIRPKQHRRRARYFSGGNQQKIVIGRTLSVTPPPKVFIFDEPTRGVDVQGRQEIMTILRRIAREGAAVLFISSELDEVLDASDRVVVMREGYTVGERLTAATSRREIISLFYGDPDEYS